MENKEHQVLKIYASTTDRLGHQLLYERLVYLAKEQGLSGVTVYRGIMGYGSSSKEVNSSKFWELTEKLPVMIEIVDEASTLLRFFEGIRQELLAMPKGCMVTLEPLKILMMKSGK
jgi:PII-like signaling protein